MCKLKNIPIVSKEVCHSNLKLIHWNIEGINSRIWGNKLKTEEFSELCKQYDIIGLSETHGIDDNFSLNGFKLYYLNRNDSTNSAGIAVFVKYEISSGITECRTNNENVLWLKLKKSFFQNSRDIYLGTVYLSPSYYENKYKLDYMNVLENDLSSFSGSGEIILMGDFNARTGNIQDVIDNNKVLRDESLDVKDCIVEPHLKKRNSQDKVSNSRGEKLVELCMSFEMSIVNGRKVGDSFGAKTCFNWNGSSVVDYVLSSNNLFDSIRYLQVEKLYPTFSIHCPVAFGMNFKEISSHKVDGLKLQNIEFKYKWSENNSLEFKRILSTNEYQSDFDKIKDELKDSKSSTHEIIGKVNNLFDVIAAKSNVKKIVRKSQKKVEKNTKVKKWFDTECKLKRKELDTYAKHLRKYHNDDDMKTQYNKIKKDYKKLLKAKKSSFKYNLIQDIKLSTYNSKVLWNKITNIKQLENDNINQDTSHITPESWLKYFTDLGQGNNVRNFPKSNLTVGNLDYPFIKKDLDIAIKKLKNNKSAGPDMIINEMIKCFYEYHSPLLLDLFNFVLKRGEFPKQWSTGLIIPLHKKGPKTDPSNYRGITLSSCLGKLFCCLLNSRLNEYIKENKILDSGQLGFVSGNRTSDGIFILHSLIDKYCKLLNKKLYVCFVDFEKAFDKIPRDLLFEKLQKLGIDGNFFNILSSMYVNDTSKVKLGNFVTDSYSVNIGVKQGCVLSPTLFNLFLSDLPTAFNEIRMHSPKIINHHISSLFWADDLAIMSTSLEGLQLAMNTLESYSDNNKLSVNIKKTKFMIFNKSGKLFRNIKLFYKNNQIELVQNFIYLGIKLSTSGSWNETLEDLKFRALRAYAKMRKILGKLFNKDIILSVKLFDSLVKPILLYGSDVWGNFKLKENSPIEQVHTKFCKHILQVNKQATNVAVKAELGRTPLTDIARINALKNWVRITRNDQNSLVHRILIETLQIQNSWVNKIKEHLFSYGLGNIWLDNISFSTKQLYSQIKQRLCDISNQNMLSYIINSPKLRTYAKFKVNNKLEDYLINMNNAKQRKYISKFRLSNHKLLIETGRYMNLSVENRTCSNCKVLEDELHLAMHCEIYEEERKLMFDEIEKIYPMFSKLTIEQKFKVIFLCDKHVCETVGAFLSKTKLLE